MRKILTAIFFIILGGVLGVVFDYGYLIKIPGEYAKKQVEDAMREGMAAQDDGPTGMWNLTSNVANLFAAEQFDELEHLLSQWNDPEERLLDGRQKLSAFPIGISQAATSNIRDWDRAYQILQHWRLKNPQSPALAISEAVYWLTYAWNARGEGYASSVTPEGVKLFQERLHKAQDALQASKSYASGNALWYQVGIEVALGTGDMHALHALFTEGAARNKFFTPIYSRALRQLEPKWGGSWELVDQFIQDGSDRTQGQEGHMLYARLYWYATIEQGPEFDLFRDTKASWPEMKQGFQEIVAAYPQSYWNLNNFASFACRAGDRNTFSDIRTKMGNHVMEQAWEKGPSLDTCEHKLLTTL